MPKNAVAGGLEDKKLLKLERKNGRNDILPFGMLERGTAAGHAVCKIDLGDNRPGTGFLISQNILLTNNHVIPTSTAATKANCTFNYELDADNVPRAQVTLKLKPDELFIASPPCENGGLDYTIVRIVSSEEHRFGHVRATRGSSKISCGEPANLIHHPDGDPKSVTIQDNRLDDDQGLLLKYLSDTEGGSSGAPVFNNRWEVVGLHFGAEPAPAGTRDMRDHPADYLNLAIKLSAIAADLERRTQIESDRRDAIAALSAFEHTDTLLGGYFGGLGRDYDQRAIPLKQIFELYTTVQDIDIGFLEANRVAAESSSRISQLAELISELALDVYILADCTRHAVDSLVKMLHNQYGMLYAAEPVQANGGAQDFLAVWNTQTVKLLECGWEPSVSKAFSVVGGSPKFEDIEGPLFDRRPERYRFARLRGPTETWPPVDIVPFWFVRNDPDSRRRLVATGVLKFVFEKSISHEIAPVLVVGGRFDAARCANAFPSEKESVAVAVEEGSGTTIMVLTRPNSSVKRVWTPPDLVASSGDTNLLAQAPARPARSSLPGSIDSRFLMVRLSFKSPEDSGADGTENDIPPDLLDTISRLT
ncbi:serine protease [Microvirga sp. VF16]|uniref:trypsin-like serine peptidase n=1 Tax=Microvirga sp. VF16 TaxID=2807101 RepID=UPI00193CEDF0|nr:serine protease [Microvirga sp. VF16]QRM35415.1 trypsin-like peptidase domain-containing protein [Microvirga sp. VF16]